MGVVDLEVIDGLALVGNAVAILIHPVALVINVVSFTASVGLFDGLRVIGEELAPHAVLGKQRIVLPQQVGQLFARVNEVGVSVLKAQGFHGRAAQAHGVALAGLERQLTVLRFAHGDLAFAKSVIQLILQGKAEFQIAGRAVINGRAAHSIKHVGHADLLGGAVEGDAQLLVRQVVLGANLLGQGARAHRDHVVFFLREAKLVLDVPCGGTDGNFIAVAQPI